MHTLIEECMATEEQVAALAAALQGEGWCCQPGFLDNARVAALRGDLLEQRPEFRPAAVGRAQARRELAAVRSDATLWLDGRNEIQRALLAAMDGVRLALNRRLYLGLSSYEAHYAHYAPGAFYQRHLDVFQASAQAAAAGPRRVLSTVFYLNDAWCDADGGELLLWADDDRELARIPPRAGTAVFFLSDAIPHEVRPARVDRYSIAGWFRTQGNARS
jgi:SM-20-related protein